MPPLENSFYDYDSGDNDITRFADGEMPLTRAFERQPVKTARVVLEQVDGTDLFIASATVSDGIAIEEECACNEIYISSPFFISPEGGLCRTRARHRPRARGSPCPSSSTSCLPAR